MRDGTASRGPLGTKTPKFGRASVAGPSRPTPRGSKCRGGLRVLPPIPKIGEVQPAHRPGDSALAISVRRHVERVRGSRRPAGIRDVCEAAYPVLATLALSVDGVRHRSDIEEHAPGEELADDQLPQDGDVGLPEHARAHDDGAHVNSLGGRTARGLPDLAGRRRRPERPVGFEIAPDGRIFILERSGKDQDRQERPAAADAVRRPAVGGHRRPRADRHRVRPRLRRLQPLRLLLLHRARPAEPPGPVQRGRGRRHRRSVRAVQDLVAVAAAARRRQHPVRTRRQALLRGRRQRQRAERPGPEQPAREDPADQQGRLDPGRQPVRRPARQAGRDLGVRVPQPVAVPVRQRHRAALRRRRGRLHAGRRSTASSRAATTAGPSTRACARSACAGFIDPIHAYPHDGESAAVTGGPVYRGDMFPPEYRGDLFFGDYAKGFIKNADLDADGDITAVHDFDDAGRQRRRPEGRSRRLALLHHLLPRRALPRQLQHRVPSAGGQRLRRRHQGRRAAHGALLERRQPGPGRRPAELPLGLRRRDDQHRAEPDEDLHREGRLHRAPDGVGRRRPGQWRSRS